MNSQPLPPESSQQRRHYIVVVHGMGEQRTNVTAPAVVERFAEARQKTVAEQASVSPNFNFIIPANLSEQSVRNDGVGHGWAEFEGIPVSKCADNPKFDGSISTDVSTNNFRFVDIAWQFILKEDIENFGSPTEEWSTALLQKLELRKSNEKNQRNERPTPPWALPMLRSIVNTAIPIKKMLAFKYADLTKYIFDGFLGDVHLYGDYGRTRGRAVRHFHAVLDEIMIRDFTDWYSNGQHENYVPPEFTIIAHSLGSIMSFDALIYAHAQDNIRKSEPHKRDDLPSSLPFPGYCNVVNEYETKNWNHLHNKIYEIWDNEKNNPIIQNIILGLITPCNPSSNQKTIDSKIDFAQTLDNKRLPIPEIPYLSWKNHVTNFITLGSPIDKFLTLWPDNYTHLDYICPEDKKAKDCIFSEGSINHYNFCDEQDPVGHHLEEAMKTNLYNQIFNAEPKGNHDVVFRRYGIPGFAHIKYFNDKDLFEKIIEHIIDKNIDNKINSFIWKEIHENEKSFNTAKRWAYYLIPFFAALATTALVSYGVMNESLLWRFAALAGALLLWIQPNVLTAYRDEIGANREMEKSWITDKWNKIRPVSSILSHLVSAAIEWRRILIVESLGPNTVPKDKQSYDIGERISFQSYDMIDKPNNYRFKLILVAFGYLILSSLLWYPAEAEQLFSHIFQVQKNKLDIWLTIQRILFLFTLIYSVVRFYVVYLFSNALKKYQLAMHES